MRPLCSIAVKPRAGWIAWQVLVPCCGILNLALADNAPPSAATPPNVNRTAPTDRGYFGVKLTEICPEVRAQTTLRDGEGIMIGQVAPDSPAAAMGLLHYDILTRFNDQWLMSPAQFVTLVENAGPGTEAEITYLRRGTEVKAKVRLARMPAKPVTTATVPLLPEEMLSSVIRTLRDNPALLEKVHRLLTGGTTPPVNPNAPEDAAESFLRHGARVTLRDQLGTVELMMIGNSQKVKAWDAQNQLIFTGPCDTPEQFEALPEELKERVARIQKECRLSTPRDVPAPSTPPDANSIPDMPEEVSTAPEQSAR